MTLRSISSQIPESTQMWIFAGFAIAFAIKAPLVPLHTWLPDAGTEAPVGAGTLLVGVLDKVGTFGFLRICLPLLPAASAKLAWLIILLAVIGIVYGAIVAAGQSDLKRFVTFTSIAHFGFIALGVFAFTTQSIAGAALYMVNHGIATGLLFIVVGMLTARGGSKLIGDYGGVWKVAPAPRRHVPGRLAGHRRAAGHQLVHLRVPGADRHLQPLPGLGGDRHHRHRAGRRLHAVDLPAHHDRSGPGRRRARRSDFGLDSPGAGDGSAGRPGRVDHRCPATGRRPARRAVSAGRRGPAGTPRGAGSRTRHAVRAKFGDLTGREIAVLTPLVVLIILLGRVPAAGAGRDQPDRRAHHGRRRVHRSGAARRRPVRRRWPMTGLSLFAAASVSAAPTDPIVAPPIDFGVTEPMLIVLGGACAGDPVRGVPAASVRYPIQVVLALLAVGAALVWTAARCRSTTTTA